MSLPRLIRINEKHARTVCCIGDNPRHYVVYSGDFGDGKWWRTFGPQGGCATKEEAEAIKDNDELLIASWNATLEPELANV